MSLVYESNKVRILQILLVLGCWYFQEVAGA
jgi:hypothetical protein